MHWAKTQCQIEAPALWWIYGANPSGLVRDLELMCGLDFVRITMTMCTKHVEVHVKDVFILVFVFFCRVQFLNKIDRHTWSWNVNYTSHNKKIPKHRHKINSVIIDFKVPGILSRSSNISWQIFFLFRTGFLIDFSINLGWTAIG